MRFFVGTTLLAGVICFGVPAARTLAGDNESPVRVECQGAAPTSRPARRPAPRELQGLYLEELIRRRESVLKIATWAEGEPGETPYEREIRRDISRLGLLPMPESLALRVKEILTNPKHRESNPGALTDAALLSGTFRLDECVPSLIALADLALPPGEMKRNWPPRSGRTAGEANPFVEALIRIGKPSVPAALSLAAKPDASEQSLDAAGRVVRGVEGELAPYAVELFIRKSENPDQTRRTLEREPFVRYWKSSAAGAAGPATRPAGSAGP